MGIIFSSFRRWWQPPRNIRDREQHRQVTFLELFYDLVYVVLVAESTHALASHIDAVHLLQFAFLFVVIYWAWINGTLYHELHGNDDIRTRVFTFLQMFTVAAMAVFTHDAFGAAAPGFALSYAAFQLILSVLWWRTGVYDSNHRPLTRPYVSVFLLNTLLFFLSAFVEAPGRFYLWGLALLLALLLPLLSFNLGRNKPAVQAQIDASRTVTPSLVERFGLFTIIVLGEVIVGTVQGVAGHAHLTVEVGVIGMTGMLLAIGLWWLYFDFVSHRKPKDGALWTTMWMYAHLPVTAGIAMTGAVILNVIEAAGTQLPADVRWLLVGAVATALVGIALMIQSLHDADRDPRTHRIGQGVMLLSASVIVASGATSIPTIPLLVLLTVLLLAPIFFGFLSWLHTVNDMS